MRLYSDELATRPTLTRLGNRQKSLCDSIAPKLPNLGHNRLIYRYSVSPAGIARKIQEPPIATPNLPAIDHSRLGRLRAALLTSSATAKMTIAPRSVAIVNLSMQASQPRGL